MSSTRVPSRVALDNQTAMFLCFQQPAIKCRNLSKFRFPNLLITRKAHNKLFVTQSYDGPNKSLLNYLFERYKIEKVMKPKSRKLPAMLRAIDTIHELDFRFTLSHDPKSISGVDDVVVLDIVNFFSLKKDARRIIDVKAKPPMAEERIEAITQLQKVNGIGPIRAHLLWESGCESIEQLGQDQFLDLLPGPTRRIYEVYEKRTNRAIPRKDVECFLDSLREILPEEFEIYLVGSYRLGHEHLAGIDVLLLHPTYTSLPRVISKIEIPGFHQSPTIYPNPPESLFKESVISKIKERGLEVITFSSDDTHWDGLTKISDEILGRTRFYLMPMASKAAALLAFTGSPVFGNNCRQKARKKGLRLNEYGLWYSDIRGPTSMPRADTTWKFLETPDEASLLQNLDIPYVEPHERDSMGKHHSRVLFSEVPPWHVTKYIPVAIQDAQTTPASKPKSVRKWAKK